MQTHESPAQANLAASAARCRGAVWIDVLFVIVLALASVKVNSRLEMHVDSDGTDETGYLALGLAIPRDGLPDARTQVFFAPLYSLWYLALAQVQPEPTRLADLNFRILTAALTVVFYALLRSLRCRPMPAALGAFLLLCHRLSLDPPTRSIHFALLLVALGMWGAALAKSDVRRGAALFLGAALAGFVRPEYAALSLAVLGATLVAGWRGRALLSRADGWSLASTVLVGAGLVAVLGAPMGAGNNRSWIAFSQHFSLHYLAKHPSGLDPWWDAAAVVSRVFPQCDSVAEALRSNPAAFCEHVTTNCREILARLPRVAVAHRNFLFPDGRRMELAENTLLLTALGLGALAMRRALSENLRAAWREHRAIALFAAATVAVGIAGMLLTSSADRYMYPIAFLGLGALCVGFGRSAAAAAEGMSPVAVACAVALFGLAPTPSYTAVSPTPVRTALGALRGLRMEEGMGYVEALAMRGFEVHLPPGMRFVHPVEKTTSLRDFLAAKKVGAIHVTPYLRTARQFAADPEWEAFLKDPAPFGFAVHPLPFHEALYVDSRALLP